MAAAGSPARDGLYDPAAMRRLVQSLIDFDRLHSGAIRVSLLAVDLLTGEEVAFDTTRDRLTIDHIMASAALIPDFPPVEIGGRACVDGGLSSNLPLDLVLGEPTGRPMRCLSFDLLPAAAPIRGASFNRPNARLISPLHASPCALSATFRRSGARRRQAPSYTTFPSPMMKRRPRSKATTSSALPSRAAARLA